MVEKYPVEVLILKSILVIQHVAASGGKSYCGKLPKTTKVSHFSKASLKLSVTLFGI